MEKLNKIKKIFDSKEDVNGILNVSMRVGFAGILIIIIIIVWSYLILKVSRSFVQNDESVIENTWNYVDTFCSSQITPPRQPIQTEDSIQCTIGKVEYKCDGSGDSYPEAVIPLVGLERA